MADAKPELLQAHITPQELAERLGVSVRLVHKWHALGVGPERTYIGRTAFYSVAVVQAWLAAGGTKQKRPREERRRRAG